MSKKHETPELIETLRKVFHYDPDTGKLLWNYRPVSEFLSQKEQQRWNTRYANTHIFTTNNKGYLIVGLNKVRHTVHRIVWAIHYGTWPTYQIDHINRERWDNRIENLREVTNTENQRNRSKQRNNTSGHNGIRKSINGKWEVRKCWGITHYSLGTYNNLKDAIQARKQAELTDGFSISHGNEGLR